MKNKRAGVVEFSDNYDFAVTKAKLVWNQTQRHAKLTIINKVIRQTSLMSFWCYNACRAR